MTAHRYQRTFVRVWRGAHDKRLLPWAEARSDKYARIMYMPTLPVAEVRAQLSRIVDEATSTHERFEITRSGQRVAVLLGADDYDALRETIAVLADTELLRAHAEGIAALQAGDSVDADGLQRAMRSAGRLPESG
jgi:antitoxin YefM